MVISDTWVGFFLSGSSEAPGGERASVHLLPSWYKLESSLDGIGRIYDYF